MSTDALDTPMDSAVSPRSSQSPLPLPGPREMTRSEFTGPTFDVEHFLNDHCEFQTLRDTHASVKKWESLLHEELVAVVNNNYDELLDVATSISRGKGQLNAVRTSVAMYDAFAEKNEREVSESIDEMEAELRERRTLMIEEGQAQQLLRAFDLLEDIETLLPRLSSEKSDAMRLEDVEMAARAYVSIVAICELFPNHRVLNTLHKRLARARNQLITELNRQITLLETPQDKLRLLTARAHTLEAQLPLSKDSALGQ